MASPYRSLRRGRRQPPSRLQRSVVYWAVVVVLSGIAGVVSFYVGRDWLGRRLGSVDLTPGAPQIVAKGEDSNGEQPMAEQMEPPPEAVVNIEEREPSPAERRRILEQEATDSLDELSSDSEDQGSSEEPTRRRSGAGTRSSSAVGPDAEPPPRRSSRDRRFIVTAGSYSDPDNAARVMERLSAQGYKPYLQEVNLDGERVQRVNVAVVQSREGAEALRDEIAQMGIKAGIVPARQD